MKTLSHVCEATVLHLICSFLLLNYVLRTESRTLAKPRALSYIANQTVCMVDKVIYRDGDPIPTDDPCETCKCRPPGFSCVLRECEVKPGCKAIRREGECCPEYQCGCEHNGKFFSDGERVPYAESPCYTCHCQGSSITCGLADCKFRFDCEPEYYPGDCCPRYDHCPPEPTSSTTSTTTSTTTTTTTTSTTAPPTTAQPITVAPETTSQTSLASEVITATVPSLVTAASTPTVTDVSASDTTIDEITTKLPVDASEPSSPASLVTPIANQTDISTGNASEVNDTIGSSTVASAPSADITSTNSPSTVLGVNESSSSIDVSATTIASAASSSRDEVVSEITSLTPDSVGSTSSNYPLEVMVTTMPSVANEVETNPPSTTAGSTKLTVSPTNEPHNTLDGLSSSSSTSSVLSPDVRDDLTTTPPPAVINVKELVKEQSQDEAMTAITIMTSSSPPSSPSLIASTTTAPSFPLSTASDDNIQVLTEVSTNPSAFIPVDSSLDTTTQISLSQQQPVLSNSSNVTRDITGDITSPPAITSELSTVTNVNEANDEITTDFPTTESWVPDAALTKEHREASSSNETITTSPDPLEVTGTSAPDSSTQSISLPSSTPDSLISSSPLPTIKSPTIDKDEVAEVTTQSVIPSEAIEVVTISPVPN